jgi:hypothetical protein
MPVGNSNIFEKEFPSTRLPTQGITDLDSQKRMDAMHQKLDPFSS